MEPPVGAYPTRPRYKGGVLALNYRGEMEVCRGNAPRSQLYESRASLTTLTDRN